MAFEDHLHVCQNCQAVFATSSFSGPQECAACGNSRFSEFDLLDAIEEAER